MKKTIYIIVPCYNEEVVLGETTLRLKNLFSRLLDLDRISKESRIIYVDDGSTDRTWEMIETSHSNDVMVSGVKLSRNCGHQNALMAGLSVAMENADVMVTIDADLQDDISIIPEMLNKFDEGCDIVYGVRKERKNDTWFKRNTALGFYKLMNILGVKSVYNHADYRLMSRRAVEELSKYRERNLFLRGMAPLLGFTTAIVYYDRSERFAGESKYPLRKMLNFAVDGITSFSVKPVRLLAAIGACFILVSLVILLYVLVSILSGDYEHGWASLMLSIWFVGGMILVGLGVVGEYIGKIYIEVKDRPLYHIEKLL
jgi:glycosyltransferase involved in cell wall biosynthesis